jgi:hypothetical protein
MVRLDPGIFLNVQMPPGQLVVKVAVGEGPIRRRFICGLQSPQGSAIMVLVKLALIVRGALHGSGRAHFRPQEGQLATISRNIAIKKPYLVCSTDDN